MPLSFFVTLVFFFLFFLYISLLLLHSLRVCLIISSYAILIKPLELGGIVVEWTKARLSSYAMPQVPFPSMFFKNHQIEIINYFHHVIFFLVYLFRSFSSLYIHLYLRGRSFWRVGSSPLSLKMKTNNGFNEDITRTNYRMRLTIIQ